MYDLDLCIIAVPENAEAAETLARRIRGYRLPKGIRPAVQDEQTGWRRVAAEASGDPEKAQQQARRSRWLAVLCSPAARDDPAVDRALAAYRSRGDGAGIMPVLVSGEPSEAMPEGFIEKRIVTQLLPDGSSREREETIEPVAADLRAETPARRRQLLQYETTRIVATLLGLHPDDLVQRHRARERRTLLSALSAAAAVCLLAAAIFLRLGYLAHREGEIAERQTQKAAGIAARTVRELPARFAEDEQASAYIEEAAEHAREVLRELGLEDLPEEEGE